MEKLLKWCQHLFKVWTWVWLKQNSPMAAKLLFCGLKVVSIVEKLMLYSQRSHHTVKGQMFIEDYKHSNIDETEVEEEEAAGCLCEKQSICHVRSTNWSIKSWIFPPACTDNLCFRGGQNKENMVCKVAWRAPGWVLLCCLVIWFPQSRKEYYLLCFYQCQSSCAERPCKE